MRRIVLLAVLGLLTGIAPQSGAADPAADPVAPAREQVKEGRFRAALEFLEPLIKSDKKNVPARLTAAEACLGLDDPDCAEEHLKVVEKTAPAAPGYQLLHGREFLLRAKRAEMRGEDRKKESLASDAADAFARALAETPGEPETLARRAEALTVADRNPEARTACEAWISAAPRNPNAYGSMAAILAAESRWSETDALIARAPTDDTTLLHEVRFAVLRSGLGVVPWPAIQPLFEQVDAGTVDPIAKQALRAYRATVAPDGPLSLLAALDYLDLDPEDHHGVRALVLREGHRTGQLIDSKNAEGLVPPHVIRKVEPLFPEPSRHVSVEGDVELLVRVRRDGTVDSVHVLSSTNPC